LRTGGGEADNIKQIYQYLDQFSLCLSKIPKDSSEANYSSMWLNIQSESAVLTIHNGHHNLLAYMAYVILRRYAVLLAGLAASKIYW
jgi:hypothetical protein